MGVSPQTGIFDSQQNQQALDRRMDATFSFFSGDSGPVLRPAFRVFWSNGIGGGLSIDETFLKECDGVKEISLLTLILESSILSVPRNSFRLESPVVRLVEDSKSVRLENDVSSNGIGREAVVSDASISSSQAQSEGSSPSKRS
jgi:hypothetical protein